MTKESLIDIISGLDEDDDFYILLKDFFLKKDIEEMALKIELMKIIYGVDHEDINLRKIYIFSKRLLKLV